MADANVLKSYLVSLGFAVNESEYQKMSTALNNASQQVTKYTTGMSKAFLQASTEIIGGLASVTAATAGLVDKVSMADLKYQEFALRMHMSLPAAREMKIVMDAMGESMENIAWIPELRERYFALQKQAGQLEQGQGAEGTFRQMRDLRFEITRLKLETTYMMQYIAVDVWNKLAGTFGNTKMSFKEFNDYITTHMPQIANMIADKLAWCVKEFEKIYYFVRDKIIPEFEHLWKTLKDGNVNTDEFKEAIVALGLAFIALTSSSGPVMLFRIGLAACIALVSDFNDYISGKKSNAKLAPMWAELQKALPTLKADFKDLSSTTKEWGKVLADLIPTIASLVDRLTGNKDSLAKALQEMVHDYLKRAKALAYAAQSIELAFQGKGSAAWSMLKLAMATSNETAPGMDWNRTSMEATSGIKTGNEGAGMLSGIGGESILGIRQSGGSSSGGGSYDDAIRAASQRYNVPEDIIRRVMATESGGNPSAVSGAGAIGLMQLMPGTAEGLGVDPYDPVQNIMGGTHYLAQMFANEGNWPDALRAYNGGPGWRTSGAAGTQENQEYAGKVLGGMAAGAQNFSAMTGSSGGYQGSGGGSSTTQTIGDININITQPGASHEQIYNSTLSALQTALQRQTARHLNDVSGVYY